MSKKQQLTILGAGATGILTAHFLKAKFNYQAGIKIIDKSNRIGGRMASTRIKSPLDSKYAFLNYGLQYLSLNESDLSDIQKEVLQELQKNQIISKFSMPMASNEPKQYKKESYFRPVKNQDILEYYSRQNSSVEYELSKKLMKFDDLLKNGDLLVATAPLPQLVNLCRNTETSLFGENNLDIENHIQQFESVKYLARYCYGCVISRDFFENTIKHNTTTDFQSSDCFYFTKEVNSKIAYIRFIEDFQDPSLQDRVGVMLHGRAFLVVDNDKNSKLNKDTGGEEILMEFCNLVGMKDGGKESQDFKDNFHGGKGHKWLYNKPLLDKNGPTFDKKFVKLGPKFLASGEAFGQAGNFLDCIEVAYFTAKEIASMAES